MPKITNFVLVKEVEDTNSQYLIKSLRTTVYATITIKYWFSKSKTRSIFKPGDSSNWKFLDTGEYVPDEIDKVYAAYKAGNLLDRHI